MAPKLFERFSLKCFERLPSELHYRRHVQFLMGLLAGRPSTLRPSFGACTHFSYVHVIPVPHRPRKRLLPTSFRGGK